MALKFFDDTSATSGSIPFLNEFVKKAKNLKTQQFEVTEIKRVKSDKGYLVITEKFQCFIWKNAKLTTQLIEALDFYINSDKGYSIVVYLPNVKKDDFKLAVDFDKEVTWFVSGNGYTTTHVDASYQDIDPNKNPFLPE